MCVCVCVCVCLWGTPIKEFHIRNSRCYETLVFALSFGVCVCATVGVSLCQRKYVSISVCVFACVLPLCVCVCVYQWLCVSSSMRVGGWSEQNNNNKQTVYRRFLQALLSLN